MLGFGTGNVIEAFFGGFMTRGRDRSTMCGTRSMTGGSGSVRSPPAATTRQASGTGTRPWAVISRWWFPRLITVYDLSACLSFSIV